MKRNIFVATGIALALATSLSTSRAQNAAPPTNPSTPPAAGTGVPLRFAGDPASQPPSPAPTGTNQPPRLPPGRMRSGRPVFSRALSDLRMAKLELQRTEGDLGGHKQSALDACDKAVAELTEVMKALPTPPPPQRPVPPPAATTPAPTAPPTTTPPPQP